MKMQNEREDTPLCSARAPRCHPRGHSLIKDEILHDL